VSSLVSAHGALSSGLRQRRACSQGPDFRGAFGGLRTYKPCNFQEAAGVADYLLDFSSLVWNLQPLHIGMSGTWGWGMALISLCLAGT